MKRIVMIMICTVFALPVILFPVCAGAAPAYDGGTTFTEVENREWILSEVRSAGKTVSIDRKKLDAAGMLGYFTVNFQVQENRVSGMGAPNRYFAPYTVGGNRALSIGNVAGTLMMPFREPDGLKESEYFGYLSKVTRWDLREGKLELYSSTGGGAEAALVFILK